MARISATDAYMLREQVHTLRLDGFSLRSIAVKLNIPLCSVQNYLSAPLPAVNPQLLLDEAISLKLERADFGPSQILDNLALSYGFARNNPPVSENTLSRLFTRLNIARRQTNHKGDKKPIYYLCAYDKPCKAYQVDTVKVVLDDGMQVELMTVVDVVSRLAWAEVLPKGGSRAWVLKRAFDAMGVPEIISTDNGAGFNLDTRFRMSDIVAYAFERGVKRFHFIPVASPWHNSVVERFHKTLKRGAWLHSGRDVAYTVDDVALWLNNELRYYNEVKSHSSLGHGTRDKVTPAVFHGGYNHLSVAGHMAQFAPSTLIGLSGVVSYTRRVDSRGLARISAPCMLFNLGTASAFGRYARFDLEVSTGEGEAYVFDEEGREGRVIGTFLHELGSELKTEGYIAVSLLSDVVVTPMPYDEVEALESERKHLKKGRPTVLPGGFTMEYLPDGDWMLRNKFGRVVDTSQHLFVDHLEEEVTYYG